MNNLIKINDTHSVKIVKINNGLFVVTKYENGVDAGKAILTKEQIESMFNLQEWVEYETSYIK